MAKLILQIKTPAGFMKQLHHGVKSGAGRRIVDAVHVREERIVALIGGYFADRFNQTAVAQALRGGSSVDLPAHFGLTDARATTLADGMAGLIRDSVEIIPTKHKAGGHIRITAVPKVWEQYAQLTGGTYRSRPSGALIPVAKWMLVDPEIDVGQAAYSIVWEGGAYSSAIAKHSRSGRALMVKLGLPEANQPYVLPAIVHKQAGQNFIEYTLGQPEVAQQAAKLLMTNLGQL